MTSNKASSAFMTTHWSQLCAEETTEDWQKSINYLCQNYWYPLFAFACYNGMNEKDAEDAVQSFFYDFLERKTLLKADPAKGKFRTYLIGAFKKHLIDLYRLQTRNKRGGDQVKIEIDGLTSFAAYQIEKECYATADDLYDSIWAQQLLDKGFHKLLEDYKSQNKELVFQVLSPVLTRRTQDLDVVEMAAKLSLSESAVYQAIVRLRQRWKKYVYDSVAETLENPTREEIQDELLYLFKCLKNR